MSTAQPPNVGKFIQRARKQQGLTLDLLAEKSGVSKAMLSQIESDKVNPTLATIWKIARGLEVELNELLTGGGEPVRKFAVAKADEHTRLASSETGPSVLVLSPIQMAEDLELYLLDFAPGTTLNSKPHAPGAEEFLTVLSGRVRVTVGRRASELAAGDFVHYHADIQHVIENIGDGPAQVHMVVRFDRRHG